MARDVCVRFPTRRREIPSATVASLGGAPTERCVTVMELELRAPHRLAELPLGDGHLAGLMSLRRDPGGQMVAPRPVTA